MTFLRPTGFLCKHGRISKGALERSSTYIDERFSKRALERSESSKKLRKISSYVSTECRVLLFTRLLFLYQKLPGNIVNTLDPNLFAVKKQRRMQIGNLTRFTFHVVLKNQWRPFRIPPSLYDSTKTPSGSLFYSPPDTKAFLYYFTPPERPRIAGELRLRVASSDDPASFESGSDLLKPNGQPWSRPLYGLSKYYIPLYEKLREERLVPDDLDAVLSSFPPRVSRYGRGQLLYTLNDAFTVDFSIHARFFSVVTEQGTQRLPFVAPFCETRPRNVRNLPYTGAYINHHSHQYFIDR
jgi:hypothetical protein